MVLHVVSRAGTSVAWRTWRDTLFGDADTDWYMIHDMRWHRLMWIDTSRLLHDDMFWLDILSKRFVTVFDSNNMTCIFECDIWNALPFCWNSWSWSFFLFLGGEECHQKLSSVNHPVLWDFRCRNTLNIVEWFVICRKSPKLVSPFKRCKFWGTISGGWMV